MRSILPTVTAAALLGFGAYASPGAVIAQVLPQETQGQSTSLTLHIVQPNDTDPGNIPAGPQHYVWLAKGDPSDPKRDSSNPRLLVFMPGAGGAGGNPPSEWQLIGSAAARLGYHAIVLAYKQDRAMEFYCPDRTDAVCAFNVRREILDGLDHSDRVSMAPANSIDNRLAKLLGYLDAQHPEEGWSAFFERDGTPKWSQMTVSGQSFGAAQSILIGMLRPVHRVAIFAGFADAGDGWISVGATRSDKQFALIHKRDRFFSVFQVACKAYLALELDRFGHFAGCDDPTGDIPLLEESSAPPYRGTHVVITDRLPQGGSYVEPASHQSTTRDGATPVAADGTPLLRDAWRYVLGRPPGGSD